LADATAEYQRAQQQYQANYKKKLSRQVRIVRPGVADEEIDEIMRSEGGRDALYQRLVLDGGINQQVRKTCSAVAGKYKDIILLERSMDQVHQLFLDLALLTEQQGEVLDNIELQVEQATDNVEEGNNHLCKSIEYQKKIRKKQCWATLVSVAIIAIIVVAIAV